MKKKWLLGLVLLLLGIGIVGLGHYLIGLRNYRTGMAAIHIAPLDLASISDGEYYGRCDVDFIRVKVRVQMKDGQMEEVELLEHHHYRGKAANVLPERMLTEQRIDVDPVSGATSSSKVIQQAVYNALTGEME